MAMEPSASNDQSSFDFIVIGAGIAGLSAAASLTGYGRTALVEMEANPCHHSSGRSAAIFVPSYGNQIVRQLTALSRQIINKDMPYALGRQRGIIIAARGDGDPGTPEPGQIRIGPSEIVARVPVMRAELLSHGWFESDASDMDVHAMHLGYIRQLRTNGQLITGFPVRSAIRERSRWQLSDGKRVISASVVVNASGAWLEHVSALFGAKPLGMVPMRRSAALVDPPVGIDPSDWPMVVDVEETVYFKPDAGKLMISPADATPSEPCDTWPEDIDVAIGIDRFQALTTHKVNRVSHMWAGLRCFMPDECPLIGAESKVEGLIWLGALGGFGVQTAPASGAIAAAIAAGVSPPSSIESGLIKAISPSRMINNGDSQ